MHLPSFEISPIPPVPSPSTSTMSLLTIKLTHDNYVRWRRQFMAALRANGFLGLLDDSESCPPATILNAAGASHPNPAHDAWQRRDALVMSWMLASMSDSVAAIVPECTTSSAAWTALAHALASRSGARVLQLRTQLHGVHRGSSSITDYMQTVKQIANSLAIIGEPVPPQDLVMQVLAGLGPAYNSFIPSITTCLREVSLEDLHAMLLAHESFLQHCDRSSDEPGFPSANSAVSGQSSTPDDASHRGRGGGKSARGRGRGRGPFCQICFASGHHYAHECPERYNPRYTGGPRQQTQVQQPPPTTPPVFSDSPCFPNTASAPASSPSPAKTPISVVRTPVLTPAITTLEPIPSTVPSPAPATPMHDDMMTADSSPTSSPPPRTKSLADIYAATPTIPAQSSTVQGLPRRRPPASTLAIGGVNRAVEENEGEQQQAGSPRAARRCAHAILAGGGGWGVLCKVRWGRETSRNAHRGTRRERRRSLLLVLPVLHRRPISSADMELGRVKCVDTAPGSVDTTPSLQKTQLPDWDSVSTQPVAVSTLVSAPRRPVLRKWDSVSTHSLVVSTHSG
ncbi:hypothetical protein Taro_003667 [Colocasia esculenta]|uniref:Retrotransposon Copia-like N-terminal domain-containing protein n=1 Tax=Colocasia esculenta TaxID=4460 RepID=A0A843TPG8_COLES|nr:hypothetical protein [Colocasia esculenta]